MASSFTLPRPTLSLYFPKYRKKSKMSHGIRKDWNLGFSRKERFEPLTSTASIELRRRRRTLICAVNQDAEKAFKKTVEVDRLIDMLREANPSELQKLVVENILAFNETFWIRLAARSDTCKSEDDKARFCFFLLQKDYEELATAVMSIVDRIVHKTHEKIDSATDVLKEILEPVVNEEEETPWPPKDPEALKTMEKKIFQMEQEGKLDEGFLAEVSAQLRQAKEDADKPGLEAMLQKVLQFYASTVLSKRSYAKKGNTLVFSLRNEVLKAEQFLETVIKAPEQEWNKLLIDGLTVGKGEISAEDFYAVIKKRIERTLIRTEGGSYQQRILTEYLKGIELRGEEVVQFLQGNTA
ncbi:Laminin subunit alpha-1 [Gossypium australe]|uniref:Laminin subunit alpha-1 n=1 Tax=Gossypium australe TaxID=47621 RepID=A0A5B6V156_9ROSI|nr:Laminin subunit alpha-1 [Gossypium australe]